MVVLCCSTTSLSVRVDEQGQEQKDLVPKKYAHRLLHLNCSTGKLGSRALRQDLSKLPRFIAAATATTAARSDSDASADATPVPARNADEHAQGSNVPSDSSSSLGIIIADTDGGKDIAIGVALAILSLYSDDDGCIEWGTRTSNTKLDKSVIRKRLSRITAAMPAAKPSRATLNAVNEFLMR